VRHGTLRREGGPGKQPTLMSKKASNMTSRFLCAMFPGWFPMACRSPLYSVGVKSSLKYVPFSLL
jgi:hypothetical protein